MGGTQWGPLESRASSLRGLASLAVNAAGAWSQCLLGTWGGSSAHEHGVLCLAGLGITTGLWGQPQTPRLLSSSHCHSENTEE